MNVFFNINIFVQQSGDFLTKTELSQSTHTNILAFQRPEICRHRAQTTKRPLKENRPCNTTSLHKQEISEDLKVK